MTKKERQKIIKQEFINIMIINLLIIFAIMIAAVTASIKVSEKNEIEDETNFAVYESEIVDHNTEASSANALDETTIPEENIPEIIVPEVITPFSRNISEEDKYLLAKIAMAEAEGESLQTKVYVILTVLNRVNSEDKYFPDTVKEVIFQNSKGVYQFSPVIPNGRWWKVEPNKECWEAVELVNGMEEDASMGALYFESCTGESWHSRNLQFICQSDNMRFYK